jgi:hypothetical protein
MSTFLITAGLTLAASAVLAAFVAIVRRNGETAPIGATADWSPTTDRAAAEECEIDAEEQAALAAATERALAVVAEAAAEMPAGLTVDPVDVLRTLSPDWRDLIARVVPELAVDGLPVLPGHGPFSGHQPTCPGCVEVALERYESRHHEDTVEIKPAGWMPPIGARRIALLTDTQPFSAATH